MTRHLLASAGGAIRQVLLFVPASEARQFAPIYSALIAQLPPDAQIALVAEAKALDAIARWPCDPARFSVIEITDKAITAWARDPLLVAQRDGAPVLLATPTLNRRDDLHAAQFAAARLGLPCETFGAMFEGGNVLVGQDCLLVGADSLIALGEDGAARFAAALQAVEGWQRRVVVIDSGPQSPAEHVGKIRVGEDEWDEVLHYRSKQGTRQPVFHIDMFVTLAGPGADGRERVLVGDPALAASLLGTALHPRGPAALFDRVAHDLEREGFAVTRNPLPMIYMDEPDKRRRVWYYASANNVLLQRGAQGDVVWLPAYGHDLWPELAGTDGANAAIWESLGFEVRTIGQAQRLAENLGGLHCLTNVLQRG